MPTITERLEMLFDAKTGGAITEIRKLNASMAQTQEAQTKTGGATGFLQTKLEGLGLSAGMASTVMAAAVPLAAGAAGAALVKFGKDAVDSTVSWANGIRLIQQSTGATAEVASKFNAILDDYSISSESAAKSFAKLGVNVQHNSAFFQEHSDLIARTKAGTVDLQGTIENIAEAYNKSGSAAERDALILDAFGRTGRDLIPILEQGRAGIEKMFADVPKGQILDQTQIDQARQYQLAIDNLQDVMLELKLTVGTALIPVLSTLANTFALVARGALTLRDAIKSNAGGIDIFGNLLDTTKNLAQHVLDTPWGQVANLQGAAADSAGKLADAQKKLIDLALAGKQGTAEYAAAQKDYRSQAEAAAHAQGIANKAIADAIPATDAAAGATGGLTAATQQNTAAVVDNYQAHLSLVNATLGLTGAELNVTQAVLDFNKTQQDGTATDLDRQKSQLNVEQAMIAASVAAVDQAEAQAELAGETLNAQQKTDIQIAELERLRDTTQPGSDLWNAINSHIEQIRSVPQTAPTVATWDDIEARRQLNDWVWSVRNAGGFVSSSPNFTVLPPLPNPTPWTGQEGGLVPGRVNQAVPAIIHGGEYVLSADVVDRIKRGRTSRGARPPSSMDFMAGSTGGYYGGPQVIQLVVSGRVLAEVTASELNKAGGPQLSARAVTN